MNTAREIIRLLSVKKPVDPAMVCVGILAALNILVWAYVVWQ